MALASASPGIVFVVKAVEPLSTAVLAIPTLGYPFSFRLFAALTIACTGIVITVLGEHGATKEIIPKTATLAAVFAAVANIGYSARACTVKKMYSFAGKQ